MKKHKKALLNPPTNQKPNISTKLSALLPSSSSLPGDMLISKLRNIISHTKWCNFPSHKSSTPETPQRAQTMERERERKKKLHPFSEVKIKPLQTVFRWCAWAVKVGSVSGPNWMMSFKCYPNFWKKYRFWVLLRDCVSFHLWCL